MSDGNRLELESSEEKPRTTRPFFRRIFRALPLPPAPRPPDTGREDWMGDTSQMGIRRALGMTVNYVYRLSDVERNHEAYAKNYKMVASHEFERLAKPATRSGASSPRG